jgi:transposase
MFATCNRRSTLFIGVDVHRDTHTAVGISPFGEKLFERTIGNFSTDFQSLVEYADSIAQTNQLLPFFGLEDCASFGERLATYLVETGKPVVSVPPILVDHARKRETHPEKNDLLDALGVAKVMIQKIDTLPLYTITETSKKAKQIKELSIDRAFLISEQTRIKNQLHTFIHRIWNTGYKTRFKNPFSKKALIYWNESYPKDSDPFLIRSLQRKIKRLQELMKEVAEIEEDLEGLIEATGHTLTTAPGIGTVIAAEIIGEVGDITRFHSPSSLAKYAGCAPKEHSSGKTHHHRKTRSGNRRLNCAFHRMALSQISRTGNEKAKLYFQQKISQGKSKSQALVCLRRHMVNIVWMMMKHKTTYDPKHGD